MAVDTAWATWAALYSAGEAESTVIPRSLIRMFSVVDDEELFEDSLPHEVASFVAKLLAKADIEIERMINVQRRQMVREIVEFVESKRKRPSGRTVWGSASEENFRRVPNVEDPHAAAEFPPLQ
ncbi:hypothetical protein RCL1_007460 [Eukaryota sp. TZLM3-RCL]